jgi:hypothetical protein
VIRLKVAVQPGDARATVARVAGLDPSIGLDAVNGMLLRVAQVYPPAVPGSTYVRTETLRDGWEPIGPFAAGEQGVGGVVNEVDYADYVMGDRQAGVHQGRWKTAEQIRDEQEAAAVATVEAAVQRRIGGV